MKICYIIKQVPIGSMKLSIKERVSMLEILDGENENSFLVISLKLSTVNEFLKKPEQGLISDKALGLLFERNFNRCPEQYPITTLLLGQ